jgi:hypothetical protein
MLTPSLPSRVTPRKVCEEEVCWSSNPRKLAAFQAKERRRGMGL